MKFSPIAAWRISDFAGAGLRGSASSTASSTSGPPARWATTARIDLPQIWALCRNSKVRAFAQLGVLPVVVRAARPGEGVVAAGIGVERDIGIGRQRRL